MKTCSSCGAVFEDDATRFCTECGKPLADIPDKEPVNDNAGSGAEVNETVPAPASLEAPFGMGNPPAAPAVPPVSTPDPQVQPQPTAPPEQPPVSGNNIVALLDRNVENASAALASPWFIIAAISYLLYAIASVANVFYTYSGNNYIKDLDQYSDIFGKLGVDTGTLVPFIEQFKTSGIITSVVMLIPMIISAIGLIIMVSCGNKKPVPTFGITMTKTEPIFKIVVSSIAILGMVCATICAIIFSASAKSYISDNFNNSLGNYGNGFSYNIPGNIGDYGNLDDYDLSDYDGLPFSGDLSDYGDVGNIYDFGNSDNIGISGVFDVVSGVVAGVVIAACVFGIIIFIFMLIYYAGLVKTLTTLKKAGAEGKCPKNRVSIFAAVIHIIAAVYLMIMFIIDLIGLGSTPDYISLASNCLGMIFFFTSAISIFKLRDSLVVIPDLK